MHAKQIFNLLTQEYTIVLATKEKDFQAVKNLRNDIISHNYPKLKETKEYIYNQDDEQSFIYLLQHNETKQYIGTVRVFFVNNHTPIQKIPMQKDFHVNNIKHLTKKFPICEISRFALSSKLVPYKHFSELQLRTYLSLALMIATRLNAFLYGYSTIFSIMELSLHRILKRQNVNFEQIGEAINYHGIRIPFAIERKELLKDTEDTMGKLTRHYLKQLCQNPEPFWTFIDNNPYLKRSDIQLERICQLFKEYGDDVDLKLLLAENKDYSTT